MLRILKERGKLSDVKTQLTDLMSKTNDRESAKIKKPTEKYKEAHRENAKAAAQNGFFNLLLSLARSDSKHRPVYRERRSRTHENLGTKLVIRKKPSFNTEFTAVRDATGSTLYRERLRELEPCKEALMHLLLGKNLTGKDLEKRFIAAKKAVFSKQKTLSPETSTASLESSTPRSSPSLFQSRASSDSSLLYKQDQETQTEPRTIRFARGTS